ncbi:hypothetical protein D3C86_1937740 [compost metagenome]
MRVAGGHRHDLRRQVFRQTVGQLRRLRQQHFLDASDAGRRDGHRLRLAARHQHVDGHAQPGGGGDGVERGAVERLFIVFGNN